MKNMIKYKVIIYTFVILGIATFSCFPKSYSKYIKEEQPLTFDVAIDKLNIGYLEEVSAEAISTYEYAHYSIRFYRSDVMKTTDEKQVIRFVVEQPLCDIVTINTKGTININENSATIQYSSMYEDYITVNYKCLVDDITFVENGNEYVYTNVNVYEKFLPENIEYLYVSAKSTKYLLDTYFSFFPKPATEIYQDSRNLIIPESYEDKYTAFTNWINQEYAPSFDNKYNNEIRTYIRSVYNVEDPESITDLSKKLDGLSVTYDSVTKSYNYHIDENFINYARTYFAYEGPDVFLKAIFLNDNLTDDECNELFKYYLEKYSNYTEEQINKIMQYIKNYGSLNYIIKPDSNGKYNQITGLTYDSELNEIQISKSLHNYAYSFVDKVINIDYQDNGNVAMHNLFTSSLPLAYNNISVNLLNKIKSNVNVYKSIIKNSTSYNPKQDYSDYFAVSSPITVDGVDTYEYALVNVYSSSIKPITYVEIIEIGYADNIVITKNNNQLDISITLDNQDTLISKNKILNTISSIDNYFNTNYKDDIIDSLFVTSSTNGSLTSLIEGNNITISYSISID